jgi:hypothetical protein
MTEQTPKTVGAAQGEIASPPSPPRGVLFTERKPKTQLSVRGALEAAPCIL